MKKMLILVILLLAGCNSNNLSNSSESNSNDLSSSSSSILIAPHDFAYIHYFWEEGDTIAYSEFFTDGGINTYSFSLGDRKTESVVEYIDLEDYGISNLIGGDTIRLLYTGSMWVTTPYPAGDATIFGDLIDIEYHQSVIYEVNLIKEVDGDQIHIGFNSSLCNDLENNYVVSKDEEGNIIKKGLSDYDDNTTLYYSFNQTMENPHKYSFLYDYKVR